MIIQQCLCLLAELELLMQPLYSDKDEMMHPDRVLYR